MPGAFFVCFGAGRILTRSSAARSLSSRLPVEKKREHGRIRFITPSQGHAPMAAHARGMKLASHSSGPVGDFHSCSARIRCAHARPAFVIQRSAWLSMRVYCNTMKLRAQAQIHAAAQIEPFRVLLRREKRQLERNTLRGDRGYGIVWLSDEERATEFTKEAGTWNNSS